jgi:hypothetical protein
MMGGEPATRTVQQESRHALEDERKPRLTPDRSRPATAEDMLCFDGSLAEILMAMSSWIMPSPSRIATRASIALALVEMKRRSDAANPRGHTRDHERR